MAPLSIGVRTVKGLMTKIIRRNTTIPTKKSATFSLTYDNQPNIVVEIYQGERALAKDNCFLGRLEMNKLKPEKKDKQTILVTFDIDANGILRVTLVEITTNRKLTEVIPTDKFKSEQIEENLRLAEKYQKKDTAHRNTLQHSQCKYMYMNVWINTLKHHHWLSVCVC